MENESETFDVLSRGWDFAPPAIPFNEILFEQALKAIAEQDPSLAPDLKCPPDQYPIAYRTQKPVEFIELLLKMMKTCPDPRIRSICTVFLRKAISQGTHLSDDLEKTITEGIFERVQHEEHPVVLPKLTYCAATYLLSMVEGPSGMSHMMLRLLLQTVRPSTAVAPTCPPNVTCLILEILATFVEICDVSLDNLVTELKPVLAITFGMKDLASSALQLSEALLSSSSVGQDSRRSLTPLIGLVLRVLTEATEGPGMNEEQNQALAEKCLKFFLQTCIRHPQFFKGGSLGRLLMTMYRIAKTTPSPELQQQALEFLLTMAEGSPSLFARVPNIVPKVIEFCFGLVAKITFNERFDLTYDVDYSEECDALSLGIEGLDRLATAIPRQVAPVAFAMIPKLVLDTSNWRKRFIGLTALCQMTEGCRSYFKNQLDELMAIVVRLASDEHPRVRFAVVHVVAQFAVDYRHFGFFEKYQSMVFPHVIIPLMTDPSNRVRAHAMTCIVNILDNAKDCDAEELILPYIDELIRTLSFCLQSWAKPPCYLSEQASSGIGSLLSNVGGLFGKYYDALVPLLFDILEKADMQTERVLRARCIEVLSTLIMCNRNSVPSDQLSTVIDLFRRVQMAGLPRENPQVDALRSAWPKIAGVAGDLFIPMLSSLFEPLLEMVSSQSMVSVLDADEVGGPFFGYDGEENFDSSLHTVHLSVSGVGQKCVRINTTVLEDKIDAINVFSDYAKQMKERFGPWVLRVIRVVMAEFPQSSLEEIREASLKFVVRSLKSLLLAVEEGILRPSVVNEFFDLVFHAMLTQIDRSSSIEAMSSIYFLVKKVNRACISNGDLVHFAQVMKSCFLGMHVERMTLMHQGGQAESQMVQIELDEMLESVLEKMQVAQELTSIVLKYHPFFVGAFMSDLAPLFFQMIENSEHRLDPYIGLCAFVELLEYHADAARGIFDRVWEFTLGFANVRNEFKVRQCALYGLGVFAVSAGDQLTEDRARAALDVLVQNATWEEREGLLNHACTANAVSSLLKFVLLRSKMSSVDPNRLLEVCLSALPVQGDILEAQIVHAHILHLWQEGNQVLLRNKVKVLALFRELVAPERKTRLVTEEVCRGMAAILEFSS